MSWRLVFLINLPLAALIVVVALRHVPESRDAASAPGLDVTGTVLAVLGLGGLTYGLTGLGPPGDGVRRCVVALVRRGGGAGGVRRRGAALAAPAGAAGAVRATRTFIAANAVTLLIYAALGVVFLLLVLQLQVVAGFSPLAAGTALLPLTAVMLVFSARAGALAGRIGPRLPLTVGPLVARGGLLLLRRIGRRRPPGADVLPAVLVFGAGLAADRRPAHRRPCSTPPRDRYAGVGLRGEQRGGQGRRAAGAWRWSRRWPGSPAPTTPTRWRSAPGSGSPC